MKLVLGILAAMLPVCAQRADMGKTPITASAVRDAGGGSVVIRNPTERTVVALAFIYTMRTADYSVVYAANGYYDSLIDPISQPPIKPGQEARFPYRIPYNDTNPVVGIDAVLFSDGSTFGEPNVVRTLYDRRNFTIAAIGKSIADLKEALKNGTGRQQLLNQLQQSMSMELSGASDQDLASCIQAVRMQVISAMFSVSRRPDGSPAPMAEMLQSEIDALSARRDALKAGLTPRPR
ncbi:MAG TPA: hypothetical protein VML19_03015 [Verrucomicrobiae bacterium]|nr:hypothetical protein [Verrucomicrobiae bacterium]